MLRHLLIFMYIFKKKGSQKGEKMRKKKKKEKKKKKKKTCFLAKAVSCCFADSLATSIAPAT